MLVIMKIRPIGCKYPNLVTLDVGRQFKLLSRANLVRRKLKPAKRTKMDSDQCDQIGQFVSKLGNF